MLNRLSRFAPFTGIVFVVAVLVGIMLSKTSPNANASGAHVIAFYTAHKSGQQASDMVIGIGSIFFLFFIASVYNLLSTARDVRTMALLGLGGALLLVLALALFEGIDFSLAYASGHLSPSAAQALNVLDSQLFLPLTIGAWTFGIATGLAIVRSRLLPAWLGWVVLVLGILTGTPATFVGLFGLLAWTLVTGILIYRRNAPPAPEGAFATPVAA